MRRIPIFKLEFEKKFMQKYKDFSNKIFNSKSLSEGEFVRKCEIQFSRFVKSKYAVSVSHGTAALETAFRVINIKS